MIPLEAGPTFVTAGPVVDINKPGTYVIATASAGCAITMPQRNYSPAGTGAAELSPPVNAYRIIVLATAMPATVTCWSADTFHVDGQTTATSITVMPGEAVLIVDDGGFWVPLFGDRMDSLGLGVAMTLDPRIGFTAAVWPVANRGVYSRLVTGSFISKIAIEVTTASGNISLAVYRNSGVGMAAVPAAQIATTGAVACPAASTGGVLREVALIAPVRAAKGDWLFMSCDNGTATFTRATTSLSTWNGAFAYRQDAAHPAPSPAGTLAATTYVPLMQGNP